MEDLDVKVDIRVKQGEAREITFTIKNKATGVVINVADPILLTYSGKTKLKDTNTVFSKANSDFDKTDAATGIVKVTLTVTDLANVSIVLSELKVWTSDTNIKKSKTIVLEIEKAIT